MNEKPCRKCGEHCFSLLENIDLNGGKPWDTCSGCMPEEGEEPQDGEP